MDEDENQKLRDALHESVRQNTDELNLREFKALHKEIEALKVDHEWRLTTLQKAIDAQRAERDRFLIWGLIVVGSAAAGMFSWLVSSIKWVIK